MDCPICDSPNVWIERRRKWSFLSSLFGTGSARGRVNCSCPTCRQGWKAGERDGTMYEGDQVHVRLARQEWQRRGFIGPDIVCNRHNGGASAEVWGFNQERLSRGARSTRNLVAGY
jgi:hypothetical protein